MKNSLSIRHLLVGVALIVALWLALGPDRDAEAVPQRMLDDASRHLRMRGGDDDTALATLAGNASSPD